MFLLLMCLLRRRGRCQAFHFHLAASNSTYVLFVLYPASLRQGEMPDRSFALTLGFLHLAFCFQGVTKDNQKHVLADLGKVDFLCANRCSFSNGMLRPQHGATEKVIRA